MTNGATSSNQNQTDKRPKFYAILSTKNKGMKWKLKSNLKWKFFSKMDLASLDFLWGYQHEYHHPLLVDIVV